MKLYAMTAHALSDLLRAGEITSVELTRAVLDRLEEREGDVKAFNTRTPALALEMAKKADKMRKEGGNTPPLTGIPIALKDNLCTKGVKTTCSSKILYNFIPPYHATVVRRLEEQGLVFIGKTNMDEFAMGSSTENSGYETTHNPWDTNRVPGGSSGGSAAAVAAGETILALGSDTGGSIRQPAAFCGVAGLKPTYGAVSRYGLIAYASSLDQIGPLAKDVRDCALLFQAVAGHDPLDSTALHWDVPDFTSYLGREVRGLKAGVPREYFTDGLSDDIREKITAALKIWEKLGVEIVEISLPLTDYALAAYYIIAPAEASSNLARYDGARYGMRVEAEDSVSMFLRTRDEGFGSEVKRRIMIGTYALSAGYYDAYYKKAQQVRTLIREEFQKAFERCDFLVTPTAPSAAFRIGEKIADPMDMYRSDIYTVTVNLAGIPGLSIPCGLTRENLPVGLQLIGPALGEAVLFQAGWALEQELRFKLQPAGVT
ncbi:MAG: Asp-tRNA(Asn)/Glu-tRNA(Gln) amidotransferase subunit GatA [Bacillota bacterium]